MWSRIWIVLLSLAAGPAAAEMATTVIIGVEGSEVVLGAGLSDGLSTGAEVTLLRQGDPIVHPLTGEILGIPQEPVGQLKIVEAQDRQAKGVLQKMYSSPMVDDLAEYEKQAVVAQAPQARSAEAGEMIERVKKLERNVKRYQKSNKALSEYPAFVEQVWDEIIVMKSYLVTLDERLLELEAQQGEDRTRLSSMLSGEYQREDMEEFTIRYMPGTHVKLKIAGKTLVITVDPDSVYHLEEVMGEEDVGMMDMDMDMEVEGEPENGEGGIQALLESQWMMWGIVGLFVLIALYIVPTMLKRRKKDDLEEDDYDEEDFLEEEE